MSDLDLPHVVLWVGLLAVPQPYGKGTTTQLPSKRQAVKFYRQRDGVWQTDGSVKFGLMTSAMNEVYWAVWPHEQGIGEPLAVAVLTTDAVVDGNITTAGPLRINMPDAYLGMHGKRIITKVTKVTKGGMTVV